MKKSAVELKEENSKTTYEIARDTALKLLEFCRANQWAGYDPYDALNSRLFRALPFMNFKLARLIVTQSVKRCPMNLRPLLLVPRTPNPKGISLFLSSIARLSSVGVLRNSIEMQTLANLLMSLRSPDPRYSCWGYNFDWQTRNELVPNKSPNIICSTFAANALLDAYEQAPDSSWLEAAISAAEFILDILYWRGGSSVTCFSYTPLRRSKIHNANLLGAALLCRVARVSGQRRFLQPALDAARYSVSKQRPDGSWPYGEALHQEWIDNFHTGYNLVALKRIGEHAETPEFNIAMRRGFEFYRAHFFREDGAPRYYHNATYPVDMHCVAQSIITLVEFKEFLNEDLDLLRKVLNWASANMLDRHGFFYFQQRRFYLVRIPFMRWTQAWMLFALTKLLESSHDAPVGA